MIKIWYKIQDGTIHFLLTRSIKRPEWAAYHFLRAFSNAISFRSKEQRGDYSFLKSGQLGAELSKGNFLACTRNRIQETDWRVILNWPTRPLASENKFSCAPSCVRKSDELIAKLSPQTWQSVRERGPRCHHYAEGIADGRVFGLSSNEPGSTSGGPDGGEREAAEDGSSERRRR